MLKTFSALNNRFYFYFKEFILNQQSFDFIDDIQNVINLSAAFIYIIEDCAEFAEPKILSELNVSSKYM